MPVAARRRHPPSLAARRGPRSSAAFDPTVLGPFTALPVQIYTWVKLPDPAFQTLAAAAIIVLLAIVLSMNAIAIFLRNRYRQTW